jgi:hypothetical protein
MPRLNDRVSADRSKNRAAIRKAPILLPVAHAKRSLLSLELMQITNADNCKEVDLLA